jgi:tetratricopeptide (TPR) repeat protein
MKLFDNAQYEEAAAGFKRLVEKYPGTYTEMAAYCNLGMAYENLRQWSQAVEYYEKALEQAGDNPEHYDVVGFSRQHRDWIVENRL